MKAVKSFAITLVIILAIGGIFLFARNSIKKDVETTVAATEESNSTKKSTANPIKKAIVSEAIDTYAEQKGGAVKEVVDSMSEEDKDAVTEIIAENVTLDSMSEVQSYVSSGDSAGLMKYAQENLSEEEQKELLEIMSKYVTP